MKQNIQAKGFLILEDNSVTEKLVDTVARALFVIENLSAR
jgi:hypothetical protein